MRSAVAVVEVAGNGVGDVKYSIDVAVVVVAAVAVAVLQQQQSATSSRACRITNVLPALGPLEQAKLPALAP